MERTLQCQTGWARTLKIPHHLHQVSDRILNQQHKTSKILLKKGKKHYKRTIKLRRIVWDLTWWYYISKRKRKNRLDSRLMWESDKDRNKHVKFIRLFHFSPLLRSSTNKTKQTSSAGTFYIRMNVDGIRHKASTSGRYFDWTRETLRLHTPS